MRPKTLDRHRTRVRLPISLNPDRVRLIHWISLRSEYPSNKTSSMNGNSHSLSPEQPQRDCAFTMIDLLVIVAVIALLLTLQIAALASTKDQTLRGQCAGHLRSLALATTIVANDNGDKLPSNIGGGSTWAWDMTSPVRTVLTNFVSIPTFYCPASGFTSVDNSNLWAYGGSAFSVIGYAQTFSGTGDVSQTNLNATLTPQRIQGTTQLMPAALASQRVLFADATLSESDTLPPTPADDFTVITGGYIKPHRTCHMDGSLPAGGNLAMLDGHVEWRPFSLMVPRSTGGGNPFFWW